ncbi:ATP-dependent DNA helicase [Candidatus Protochlamydia phocaeensis]|uniref:ATP-dependent DNA helicase n=1 Tax=Candidatus Protochlamydia phocaeensis TaxID=1414722 RepID=UPI000B0466A6|nr:helicase C-terminal domain-containing protein [Candidatus Protochlamydia phocaeensis]
MQELNIEKILKLIQPDGMLSQALKGFESRPQQHQMMTNVIQAYNQDLVSLIEAGTGTGKSLAYLIPALIWAARFNERTVISTNTITLQEQLIHKDIPHLLEALNLNLKVVLVKGMNNYVCLRKLEDAQTELRLFPTEEKEEVEKVNQWCQGAIEGSRSEMPFVPSPSVWDRIGAESEACLHHECPYYQQCYFFKARRQAQDAHVLVANHHLLFADLVRRAETNNYSEACLLPIYRRIILDEAHHIEDIATEYFAARLHRVELMRTLGRLASDRHGSQQGKLLILKEKLQSLFNKTPPRDVAQIISRLTIDLPALRHLLLEQINHTFDAFAHFIESINQPLNQLFPEEASPTPEKKLRIVKDHLSHPKWKEDILPHTTKLIAALKQYRQTISSLEGDLKLIENDRLQEQTKGMRLDIQALAYRLEIAISLLDNFISDLQNANKVRWIEAHKLKSLLNVHLVDADLDISKALVNFLFSKFSTVILCSATLASNQQFQFVRQRLGLTERLLPQRKVTEHIYDSPFNYRQQALLVVPTDMPPPSHPDFNALAYENIWNAIQASRGQAFVLFTSYTMLQNCYEALSKKFQDHRYPLFKQGDDSRQTLLNKFKKTDRAVLFGTDSFWEGVDVAGDALRCVIIVKLPFKVPSEPIIQARTEAIMERGGDPFFEFSVPHAIVKFKQGFGRLIRNKSDRGCIVCLDNRLVTKGYGRLFLNSLPPCEKVFANGAHLWSKMHDFYRKTYHLVKNN